MSEGTAVARTDAGKQELEAIRRQGAHEVARAKALNEISRKIHAAQWGKNLSGNALAAMALWCDTVGANPVTEVEILGNRPYLNAEYAVRRMSEHPHYVEHEMVNITDDVAERAKWGAPDDATAVYVCRIRRFSPSAPLAAIRAGKLSHEEAMKWTQWVEEANWAGHTRKQGDPVGQSEPHKTARTRTLRRAVMRCFGAWAKEIYQAEERATEIVEAEWEEIRVEDQEPLEGKVQIGAGEPGPAIDETPAQPEDDPELLKDAHRRYFATLRERGITKDEDRKRWQADNGFAESTKEWRLRDFERAVNLLLQPIREGVEELCERTGTDLEALSMVLFSKAAPDYAREWMQVWQALQQKAAAAEAEEADANGQTGMEL